jgi:hypothetical protein
MSAHHSSGVESESVPELRLGAFESIHCRTPLDRLTDSSGSAVKARGPECVVTNRRVVVCGGRPRTEVSWPLREIHYLTTSGHLEIDSGRYRDCCVEILTTDSGGGCLFLPGASAGFFDLAPGWTLERAIRQKAHLPPDWDGDAAYVAWLTTIDPGVIARRAWRVSGSSEGEDRR